MGVNNSAKAQKGRKFTPWSASAAPPPGTYDPALDSTLRAANRGYGDFQASSARDALRQSQDYSTGLEGIMRSYARQGQSQLEAGNAAGLLGGGFQAQAAAKRTANADIQRGALALGQTRATEDRTTALTTAGRENVFFGQDTNASRIYQARSTGWVPPTKPKNERTQGALTYRQLGPNRYLLPSGQIVNAQQLQRNPKYGFSLFKDSAQIIKQAPDLARAMGLI